MSCLQLQAEVAGDVVLYSTQFFYAQKWMGSWAAEGMLPMYIILDLRVMLHVTTNCLRLLSSFLLQHDSFLFLRLVPST